jgi:hypothetical protein
LCSNSHDQYRLGAGAYLVCFVVATATAAATLGLLVAIGETSAFENAIVITVATLAVTYAVGIWAMQRRRAAIVASSLFTTVVVTGGWALLYALLSSLCGGSPSSC